MLRRWPLFGLFLYSDMLCPVLFGQLQHSGDILTGTLDIGRTVLQQLIQLRSAGNDAEDRVDALGVQRINAFADVAGQGDDFLPPALAVAATP